MKAITGEQSIQMRSNLTFQNGKKKSSYKKFFLNVSVQQMESTQHTSIQPEKSSAYSNFLSLSIS